MAEINAGRRRGLVHRGRDAGTLGLGGLLAMLSGASDRRIVATCSSLGKGELNREIHLPYARELVHLSDDINQMTAGLRDRLALRRSLAMAMEVQQNLLPSRPRKSMASISSGTARTATRQAETITTTSRSQSFSRQRRLARCGQRHGTRDCCRHAHGDGTRHLRMRSTEIGSLGELLGHLNDMLVEVTGG